MKNMLRISIFIIIGFILTTAASANKYEVIDKNKTYTSIIISYDNKIAPETNWVNYLNCLISYDDLVKLAKSGELDNEKSKYILSSGTTFIKFLHFLTIQQMGKFNPPVEEKQIMYVTGVIKSSHAQAASNSSELQVEKQVLRGFMSYRLWEKFNEPGFRKATVEAELDRLYQLCK